MRVLIAGGTGNVGRLMVPALVADGHDVIALSRSAAGLRRLDDAGARGVHGDVLDRDALIATVGRLRPDAIINQVTDLAGLDFAANARARGEGTRNLVDAAQQAGTARFVTQSIAWMYVPGDTPAREEVPLDLDAPEPRRTTVAGVLAAEQAVAAIAEHLILRYGAFYGPGTWRSQDGLFTRQLRDGTFTGSAGLTSFIHIADADAAAAARAALGWPPGAVNVVDDEPATGADWLTETLHVVPHAQPTELTPAQPWERGADNTRLHELGFRLAHPTWRGQLARR